MTRLDRELKAAMNQHLLETCHATIIIDGAPYFAEFFAYDGCHKIYLIEDDDQAVDAEDAGYTLLPIDKLALTYEFHACPLRFIDTWSLEAVVPQFADSVVFEYL